MSEPATILITCVGGTMVPSALRWLREHSRIPLWVLGVDAKEAPLARVFLDGFHRVPMGGDADYVDVMVDIARRQSVRIIVPWSDGEAIALSTSRARFAEIGCDIFVSPADVLNVLQNKLATYRKLRDAGVPVPEHAAIDDPAALAGVLADYGYPQRTVVVKPVDGRGGRGMFVLIGQDGAPEWLGSGRREGRIDTEAFADTAPSALITGESLVMPRLYDPVYDADVLAREGKVLSEVIRRRHNPTGIPWTGNTICRNPAFEFYARRIAEVLGLDGAHDIDLMSDADGNPALLEVNPRMSGSLAATLSAGVPFLDAALASRLGIELAVDLPDEDVEVAPYTEAVAL